MVRAALIAIFSAEKVAEFQTYATFAEIKQPWPTMACL